MATVNIPGVGHATTNADGSYTLTDGPYAGMSPDDAAAASKKINDTIASLKPDKQGNLINPQTGQIAVSWGQLNQLVWTGQVNPTTLPPGTGWLDPAHGGFAPGQLHPDGKGNFSLVGPDGKPAIITATGAVLNPDGSPRMDASGKPETSYTFGQTVTNAANTPIKDPLGDVIKDTLNGVQDAVTKGNPVAGVANAGYDLATGNKDKVLGDLTNGATGGLVNVDDKGNIAPGTLVKDAGSVASDAGVHVPGLPDISLSGGDAPSVGGAATDEVTRANNLADVLEGERQKAGTQADVDRGKGDETRDLQYQSVRDLQDAAAGRVPSAAELALTRQSGIDASRQFGLAAALQGNNPAAALRQASMGAAQVAGDTSSNAAILRAKEQADARSTLANTLGNVRNQDNGAVNTDVTQQGNAQSGETTSQGQGVTAEGNVLNAETERDKAKKTLEGAEISAVGTGLGGLLTKSDKRAKKNISRASLADALADGVHGVTFEYRRPDSGEDGSKHFGLLAQELERIVPGVVKPNADGVKMVDAGHLTMGNTAILAELAKRIQELEKGARK